MRRTIIPAALVVVTLGGCTQAAQLQPVAGGQVSAVRTATNDVLVDERVDIDVAPVCEFEDPLFVCLGTTLDGEEIRSEAEVLAAFGDTETEYGAYTPADVSLVVTVAGERIFDGKVEDVLVDNGEVGK
jgi:hypothetical protein